jgi:Na+/H+-dicarboxylate symporter
MCYTPNTEVHSVRIALNTQILIGAILGIGLGAEFIELGPEAEVTKHGLYLCGLVGTLFIDMLKMVLAPLVFTSIVVGVSNLRLHQQMHNVWKVTLGFFTLSMSISIALGLGAANFFAPGKGLNLNLFANAQPGFAAKQLTFPEFVAEFLHGIFLNPFAALVQGNVLAIVVFALLLGIAIVAGGDRYRNVIVFMQEGLELILRIVSWIMRLSPYGIFALLAKLLATQSLSLLSSLVKFISVILGTTLLHGFVILPLILFLFTGIRPWRFFKGAREALITAFATSSSSATLPVTLRCVEQHLHVTPGIAGFVIPLGATMNMDGTALYEASAALFVANLAGIDLNIVQQLIVFFTTMIAAMGAPGIPSAGMVTMIMVLQSVGLPTEAIAILLPIDRILDTVRTMVNVEGDMIGSLVVNKWAEKNP